MGTSGIQIGEVAGNSLVLLAGLIILILNKKIGDFAEKNMRNLFGSTVAKYVPWFPRLNAILIGLMLACGGLINVLYDVMASK